MLRLQYKTVANATEGGTATKREEKMKKFLIIMAMAAVLPIAALFFGRCASADSTAQRETPARSTAAQENAGLAIRQVEIYPQMGLPDLGWSSPTLKFSPDGKWLFGNAGIFDAATGRELKRPYNTSIVGFSPDMQRYIQGSGSIFRVRNWETDTVIVTIQNTRDQTDTKPVFSPDGRQVAALTGDGKNIKILDATNGQEIMIVEGWEGGISSFGYSADGRNIILANSENVKVFDLVNKQQLRTFSVRVTSGNFQKSIISPNGKYYIVASTTGSVGSYSGSVKIYDTDTGREVRTLSGHGSFVTALACSPDGQRIISVDRNNVMKVWDTATGRELRSTTLDYDNINNAVYSADNRHIVFGIGTGTVTVLDAGNYRELLTIKTLPRITNAPYIVNEKQAIIQTNNNDNISLWDTETGRRIWSIPFQGQDSSISIWPIYLSPNKRFFAKKDTTTNSAQGLNNISIYDTATGRLLRSWPNRQNSTTFNIFWNSTSNEIITFSPPYVSSVNRCYIDIWNIENGQRSSNFTHTVDTYRALFSGYSNSDASKIFYKFDNSLQIYETRGTNKLLTITGSFRDAQWSHDSRRILTTSDDGTVRIWDAQTGRQQPVNVRQENIRAVQYSPDGRQFATGGNRDGYIRGWNAENGALLWEKRIAYGDNSVDSINYSGNRIIAVTSSQSVYVLDSSNGDTLFNKAGRSASLSPDGKWVIVTTASHNGSLRIYSIETGVEKVQLITYEDNEWLDITPDGY